MLILMKTMRMTLVEASLKNLKVKNILILMVKVIDDDGLGQEVDEESIIEEPAREESVGLRLRRPSIGVARLFIVT